MFKASRAAVPLFRESQCRNFQAWRANRWRDLWFSGLLALFLWGVAFLLGRPFADPSWVVPAGFSLIPLWSLAELSLRGRGLIISDEAISVPRLLGGRRTIAFEDIGLVREYPFGRVSLEYGSRGQRVSFDCRRVDSLARLRGLLRDKVPRYLLDYV